MKDTAKAFLLHTRLRMRVFAETVLQNVTKGALPGGSRCFYSTIPKQRSGVRVLRQDEKTVTLTKTEADGRPFRILSSTDFHYKYDDKVGLEPDLKATRTFLRHVAETKPDLIVLTGDIVLGDRQFLDSCRFAHMMAKVGVPWVYVIGNHEIGNGNVFDRFMEVYLFAHSKGCLTKLGPKDVFGYGNFVIDIAGRDGVPYQKLFFFDSGDNMIAEQNVQHGFPESAHGYDYLKRDQINFYSSEVENTQKKYGDVKSMMYMHIALPEYGLFYRETDERDVYERTDVGTYYYGEQHESVGSAPVNSGMFDAILRLGSTHAVFAGHDHINDWCVEYKGVKFVYSQPGGYTAYHLGTARGLPEERWQQGVTVTDVYPDGSIKITPRYNRAFLEH